MDISEIPRLIKFSEKSNKGKANTLYTSGIDGQIDVGFFQTKIVKAALKAVRRKKTTNLHEYDDEVSIPLNPEVSYDVANDKEIDPDQGKFTEIEDVTGENIDINF